MNDNTFVKEYRSILNWEWYKKPLTAHLFRHLILIANIEDKSFRGIIVHRGQTFTSIPNLALETGLSEREVRTAISHLISTGELTDERHPFGRLITVVSYDKYQAVRQTKRQSIDSQTGTDASVERTQLKNIKKDTNVSKEKKKAPATPTGGGRAEWEIRQKVPDMFIGQFESEEAYLSLMSGEGYDPH